MKSPSATAHWWSRSFLFVPGDRPEMLRKAGQRDADAIIIDLEDAVARSKKREARKAVRELLGSNLPDCETWVRINSGEDGIVDALSLRAYSIAGLMVPKLRSINELDSLSDSLGHPDLELIALIETAEAVTNLDAICSHPRVNRLMIGEADLGSELGMAPDSVGWDVLRVQVVVASAAAAIRRPIGSPDPDFSNADKLLTETTALKNIGFGARAVIHPNQVSPVNQAFTPQWDDLERARKILGDHEAAVRSGRGAYEGEDGEMVDEAFVRRARELVALADQLGQAD
jgi:citrate lyase subunit beta/citryl-CoA lyase